MNQSSDRVTSFLPWLGLLLLLAGAIVTFVTRRFELLNNLLLAGGALILLGFAMLRPGEVRRLLGGRQTRYGLSTILSILFFTVLAGSAYVVAYNNPDWRFDTTEEGQFTPLPETVSLLETLDEPVHVIGFFTLQQLAQQDQAEDILRNLQSVSDKLSYEFQDPEVNPLAAQEYDINVAGTLVFVKGEGEDRVFSKATSLSGNLENDLHVALVKVVNPVAKQLYFLVGHGEPSIEAFDETGLATAVGLLEDSGFTVAELNLNVTGEVPADATVVALVKPAVPLQPVEVDALEAYLDQGGSLFIARDVVEEQSLTAEGDPFNQVLADKWGIAWRSDVIVEEVFAQAGAALDLTFLAAGYGNSPITTDLDRFGTVFGLVRSIETTPVDGVQQVTIVETSDRSWGESDFAGLATGFVNPDEVDAAGPLAVGVSAENSVSGGRVVAFGDGEFFNNITIAQLGNSLLFTNALNWLADDELSINLAPREPVSRQMVIPQERLALFQLIGLCLGPAIMGLIGLFVWYSRRQRQ